MLKKTSKSVCTSTAMVYPDPLSLTPSTSSAIKTPENTEGDPDGLNQQIEEISKWNTPLIRCTAQVEEQ
jgi:hypothetical protein